MFEKVIHNLHDISPLVHCITNYVTVNDVANIILACGASPIMADDESESEQITSICNSLAINIGTLNSRTIKSMILAGKKANELNHPVILDPVGIGASSLRTSTVQKLLDNIKFTVIRGNISEIKAIYGSDSEIKGVDANANDKIDENNYSHYAAMAKHISNKTGAIIAISGPIDIVADNKTAFIIRNGNALMSKITGTGCMLTGLIASFVSADYKNALISCAAAVCSMALAGEIAYEKIKKNNLGTSSYRTFIIDSISNMTDEILKRGVNIEILH